jgi:hypothetical protein
MSGFPPTTTEWWTFENGRNVPTADVNSKFPIAETEHCALNWLMIGKTTSPVRIALSPFGRDDFDRLISWLPTEDDLVEWCAGFFRYPLTYAQLERYLESSQQPNARVIFAARTMDGEAVGHIEVSQIWPHLSSRLSRVLVVPDQRHQGIGSTIIREALSFSFVQHSVDLSISAYRPAISRQSAATRNWDLRRSAHGQTQS